MPSIRLPKSTLWVILPVLSQPSNVLTTNGVISLLPGFPMRRGHEKKGQEKNVTPNSHILIWMVVFRLSG